MSETSMAAASRKLPVVSNPRRQAAIKAVGSLAKDAATNLAALWLTPIRLSLGRDISDDAGFFIVLQLLLGWIPALIAEALWSAHTVGYALLAYAYGGIAIAISIKISRSLYSVWHLRYQKYLKELK